MSSSHPSNFFCLTDFQQVTAYPVSRGTRINVAAFRTRYDLQDTKLDVPWVEETTKDEILGDFDGWEEEVQALIDVSPSNLYALLSYVDCCCSASRNLVAGRCTQFAR